MHGPRALCDRCAPRSAPSSVDQRLSNLEEKLAQTLDFSSADARAACAVRLLCDPLAVLGPLSSVASVMTAASVGAAKGGGYARYLESKTIEPERGGYYLKASGEPTQAPGRWLASPETLARLGIEGGKVDGADLSR
jgi:hypothetical protein